MIHRDSALNVWYKFTVNNSNNQRNEKSISYNNY